VIGQVPSEGVPEQAATPPASARDLVRRRARSYARDETGRHHHIGAAPESQPLHTDEGASRIGTSAVQLASRTVVQLRRQRERTAAAMTAAAQDLRFEDAARLRDDLTALDAELVRRVGGDPSSAGP
jgi:excinuclease UvrABC helicase subunit UvrB